MVAILLFGALALHRGWIVTGREYARQVARNEVLEAEAHKAVEAKNQEIGEWKRLALNAASRKGER